MIECQLYEKDCENTGYVTAAGNRMCVFVWCICFTDAGRRDTGLCGAFDLGMHSDAVWRDLLSAVLFISEEKKNRSMYSCVAMFGISECYGMVSVWTDFSERALWTVSNFTSGRCKDFQAWYGLSVG